MSRRTGCCRCITSTIYVPFSLPASNLRLKWNEFVKLIDVLLFILDILIALARQQLTCGQTPPR